jgi:hypothetical protein
VTPASYRLRGRTPPEPDQPLAMAFS